MSATTLINAAKNNRALAAVLATDPEWKRTIDFRAAVQMKMAGLAASPVPPAPSSADELDDWLQASITAADSRASTERHRLALKSLAGELTNGLDGFVFVHGNRMLTSLHTELRTVMDDVADVADKLKGAHTATEAIAVKAENHWRALSVLREWYDEIRAAQDLITFNVDPAAGQHATSEHLPDPLASDLAMSNVDDLIPGWRQRDTRYAMGGDLPRRTPWPTDPVEQLVWLSTSTARPWVPTTDQLEQLNDERLDRPAMKVQPIVIHGRPDRKETAHV